MERRAGGARAPRRERAGATPDRRRPSHTILEAIPPPRQSTVGIRIVNNPYYPEQPRKVAQSYARPRRVFGNHSVSLGGLNRERASPFIELNTLPDACLSRFRSVTSAWNHLLRMRKMRRSHLAATRLWKGFDFSCCPRRIFLFFWG